MRKRLDARHLREASWTALKRLARWLGIPIAVRRRERWKLERLVNFHIEVDDTKPR